LGTIFRLTLAHSAVNLYSQKGGRKTMIARKSIGIVSVISFLMVFGCGKEKPKELPQGYPEGVPKEIVSEKDDAKMVLIPAGEFEMGTDASEIPQLVQLAEQWLSSAKADWLEDETPRHTVYLSAFYMDVYEVTNARYHRFVEATGHKEPGYWDDSLEARRFYGIVGTAPDQPVVHISWHDAVAYCKWAGKRLPTEAEWEKAARGALVGKWYPWGNDISHDDANYSGTGGKDVWEMRAPVGSFARLGYGLYDMAGNVCEWCADWYDKSYYAKSPKQNPKGPRVRITPPWVHVSRGGSSGHGASTAGRKFLTHFY